MESLTLETNARKIFTTSEEEVIHPTPFDLICLDNISESFELVPGQNQEILPGMTLKVDELGNGILELTQKCELSVKISGKKVEEVAQFQGNDLITVGDKDFMLLPKEGAMINPNACEFEMEETQKEQKLELDESLDETLERNDDPSADESKKQKRKRLFSLFLYSITCIIIASFGLLLFMNSKISDFNRMADMANIFQSKIARLLKQKTKVVIKHIPIPMEQLFKEDPSPTPPQPDLATIKKKRKTKLSTSEATSIPGQEVKTESFTKKPVMAIGQKDREHVLKEIEMLKLEYRLDPYNVRKSLQEMRDSLSDKSLRRKIDQVLQRL
ncbi:MAG: hypothetical protein AABY86_03750 [Bdellovibrionota bacterium]